jgi:hypothetical protein
MCSRKSKKEEDSIEGLVYVRKSEDIEKKEMRDRHIIDPLKNLISIVE